MAQVVIMPKQGQSVESCIVTEFKKKVGDKVAVGDILFSYETDKASFDEESKFEGTVLACFFNDNDEIPCLTNVMVIGEPGESFEEFAPGGEAPAAAAAPAVEDVPQDTTATLGTLRGGTVSEANGGAELCEAVEALQTPSDRVKRYLVRTPIPGPTSRTGLPLSAPTMFCAIAWSVRKCCPRPFFALTSMVQR